MSFTPKKHWGAIKLKDQQLTDTIAKYIRKERRLNNIQDDGFFEVMKAMLDWSRCALMTDICISVSVILSQKSISMKLLGNLKQ